MRLLILAHNFSRVSEYVRLVARAFLEFIIVVVREGGYENLSQKNVYACITQKTVLASKK